MNIRKYLDSLGRLCIPKSIRDNLEIIPDETPVEVYESDNMIIIRKIENACTFCRNKENITEYSGKYICDKCIQKIKDI